MSALIKTGQVFFGICLAGMGSLQFIYPGFRPVLIPEFPSWIPGTTFWVYLTGTALIFAGICIVTGWKGRIISLLTGAILLLFVVFFHIPFQLKNDPGSLGAWTNAVKLLAFSGSAFITAATFPRKLIGKNTFSALEKLIPFGRIFFSVMLILFGIDHLLYVDFVKTLVPRWIPGDVFWTYFAAAALIGSGLAILFKIQIRRVAILLGFMLLIWFVILHIPRALDASEADNGNELTSVFQALGFSGVSFMIAGLFKRRSLLPG
jgi:uncharacterized membrane protein YphA (DoxX/SURF4 family)